MPLSPNAFLLQNLVTSGSMNFSAVRNAPHQERPFDIDKSRQASSFSRIMPLGRARHTIQPRILEMLGGRASDPNDSRIISFLIGWTCNLSANIYKVGPTAKHLDTEEITEKECSEETVLQVGLEDTPLNQRYVG